jgi:holliday junction DNA helicase RuvA
VITQLTGTLVRVLDDECRVRIGPFEYQILIPEAVRRQIQSRTGEEITFYISEYYEGNQSGTRLVPRKIGFASEAELEFFELFCTVDKIGVKKALKALARPVREIAEAIAKPDVKWLATLPGIGAATAETIATTLKRKVAKFALPGAAALPAGNPIIEDAYAGLVALGLSPLDARAKLDAVLKTGEEFTDTDTLLRRVFGGK